MTRRPCLICGTLTNGSRCPTHALRRNGSTRAWRATRADVLYRDQHRCQQCGAPAGHAHHVVPVSRGGTDDLSNLAALCADCNLAKGNR